MSVYLRIEKVHEDEYVVRYKFGSSDEKYEILEIEKATENANKIDSNTSQPRHYFLRAVAKILKHNKNNPEDNYPDFLIYAT